MPRKDISILEKPPKSRGLLGRTTVLILSSYLVGISTGHRVLAGLEIYTLLAGACGVVAYFGCEYVARYREERILQAAYDQAAVKLDKLMEHERNTRSQPKKKTLDSAQQPLSAVDSH